MVSYTTISKSDWPKYRNLILLTGWALCAWGILPKLPPTLKLYPTFWSFTGRTSHVYAVVSQPQAISSPRLTKRGVRWAKASFNQQMFRYAVLVHPAHPSSSYRKTFPNEHSQRMNQQLLAPLCIVRLVWHTIMIQEKIYRATSKVAIVPLQYW